MVKVRRLKAGRRLKWVGWVLWVAAQKLGGNALLPRILADTLDPVRSSSAAPVPHCKFETICTMYLVSEQLCCLEAGWLIMTLAALGRHKNREACK